MEFKVAEFTDARSRETDMNYSGEQDSSSSSILLSNYLVKILGVDFVFTPSQSQKSVCNLSLTQLDEI
jgi:hypothetical protein